MPKSNRIMGAGLAVAASLLTAVGLSPAPAAAAVVNWDFTSSCASTGACNDTENSNGNIRTFTSNGHQVRVFGVGITGNSNTTAQTAWLGQYLNSSGGLGITNQDEGGGGNGHTVDNSGQFDLAVFVFDSQYDMEQAVLHLYDSNPDDSNNTNDFDGDISVWVGNSGGAFSNTANFRDTSIVGRTLAQLDTAFGNHTNLSFAAGNSATTAVHNLSSLPSGNVLILGTNVNGQLDGAQAYIDRFKMGGVSANTPSNPPSQVPVPGSALLMGLALVGASVFRLCRAR